jgi:hypothetical protein
MKIAQTSSNSEIEIEKSISIQPNVHAFRLVDFSIFDFFFFF